MCVVMPQHECELYIGLRCATSIATVEGSHTNIETTIKFYLEVFPQRIATLSATTIELKNEPTSSKTKCSLSKAPTVSIFKQFIECISGIPRARQRITYNTHVKKIWQTHWLHDDETDVFALLSTTGYVHHKTFTVSYDLRTALQWAVTTDTERTERTANVAREKSTGNATINNNLQSYTWFGRRSLFEQKLINSCSVTASDTLYLKTMFKPQELSIFSQTLKLRDRDRDGILLPKQKHQFDLDADTDKNTRQLFLIQTLCFFDELLSNTLSEVIHKNFQNHIQQIRQNLINILFFCESIYETDISIFDPTHLVECFLDIYPNVPWNVHQIYKSTTKNRGPPSTEYYNAYVEFLFLVCGGVENPNSISIDSMHQFFKNHEIELQHVLWMEEQLFGIYAANGESEADTAVGMWALFQDSNPEDAQRLRQMLQYSILNAFKVQSKFNDALMFHDMTQYFEAMMLFQNLDLPLEQLVQSDTNLQNMYNEISKRNKFYTDMSTSDQARSDVIFFQKIADFIFLNSIDDTNTKSTHDSLITPGGNLKLSISEEERLDGTLRILTTLAAAFRKYHRQIKMSDVQQFHHFTSCWYYLSAMQRAVKMLKSSTDPMKQQLSLLTRIEQQLKTFAQLHPLDIINCSLHYEQSIVFHQIQAMSPTKRNTLETHWHPDNWELELHMLRSAVQLQYTDFENKSTSDSGTFVKNWFSNVNQWHKTQMYRQNVKKGQQRASRSQTTQIQHHMITAAQIDKLVTHESLKRKMLSFVVQGKTLLQHLEVMKQCMEVMHFDVEQEDSKKYKYEEQRGNDSIIKHQITLPIGESAKLHELSHKLAVNVWPVLTYLLYDHLQNGMFFKKESPEADSESPERDSGSPEPDSESPDYMYYTSQACQARLQSASVSIAYFIKLKREKRPDESDEALASIEAVQTYLLELTATLPKRSKVTPNSDAKKSQDWQWHENFLQKLSMVQFYGVYQIMQNLEFLMKSEVLSIPDTEESQNLHYEHVIVDIAHISFLVLFTPLFKQLSPRCEVDCPIKKAETYPNQLQKAREQCRKNLSSCRAVIFKLCDVAVRIDAMHQFYNDNDKTTESHHAVGENLRNCVNSAYFQSCLYAYIFDDHAGNRTQAGKQIFVWIKPANYQHTSRCLSASFDPVLTHLIVSDFSSFPIVSEKQNRVQFIELTSNCMSHHFKSIFSSHVSKSKINPIHNFLGYQSIPIFTSRKIDQKMFDLDKNFMQLKNDNIYWNLEQDRVLTVEDLWRKIKHSFFDDEFLKGNFLFQTLAASYDKESSKETHYKLSNLLFFRVRHPAWKKIMRRALGRLTNNRIILPEQRDKNAISSSVVVSTLRICLGVSEHQNPQKRLLTSTDWENETLKKEKKIIFPETMPEATNEDEATKETKEDPFVTISEQRYQEMTTLILQNNYAPVYLLLWSFFNSKYHVNASTNTDSHKLWKQLLHCAECSSGSENDTGDVSVFQVNIERIFEIDLCTEEAWHFVCSELNAENVRQPLEATRESLKNVTCKYYDRFHESSTSRNEDSDNDEGDFDANLQDNSWTTVDFAPAPVFSTSNDSRSWTLLRSDETSVQGWQMDDGRVLFMSIVEQWFRVNKKQLSYAADRVKAKNEKTVSLPNYKKEKFELRRIFDMHQLQADTTIPDEDNGANIDWYDAETMEKVCSNILHALEHDMDAVQEVTRGKFGVNCLRALSILRGEKEDDKDVMQTLRRNEDSDEEHEIDSDEDGSESDVEYSSDDDNQTILCGSEASEKSMGVSSAQSSKWDRGITMKLPEHYTSLATLLLPGFIANMLFTKNATGNSQSISQNYAIQTAGLRVLETCWNIDIANTHQHILASGSIAEHDRAMMFAFMVSGEDNGFSAWKDNTCKATLHNIEKMCKFLQQPFAYQLPRDPMYDAQIAQGIVNGMLFDKHVNNIANANYQEILELTDVNELERLTEASRDHILKWTQNGQGEDDNISAGSDLSGSDWSDGEDSDEDEDLHGDGAVPEVSTGKAPLPKKDTHDLTAEDNQKISDLILTSFELKQTATVKQQFSDDTDDDSINVIVLEDTSTSTSDGIFKTWNEHYNLALVLCCYDKQKVLAFMQKNDASKNILQRYEEQYETMWAPVHDFIVVWYCLLYDKSVPKRVSAETSIKVSQELCEQFNLGANSTDFRTVPRDGENSSIKKILALHSEMLLQHLETCQTDIKFLNDICASPAEDTQPKTPSSTKLKSAVKKNSKPIKHYKFSSDPISVFFKQSHQCEFLSFMETHVKTRTPTPIPQIITKILQLAVRWKFLLSKIKMERNDSNDPDGQESEKDYIRIVNWVLRLLSAGARKALAVLFQQNIEKSSFSILYYIQHFLHTVKNKDMPSLEKLSADNANTTDLCTFLPVLGGWFQTQMPDLSTSTETPQPKSTKHKQPNQWMPKFDAYYNHTISDLLKPLCPPSTDSLEKIIAHLSGGANKSCIIGTGHAGSEWHKISWGIPLHRRLLRTCGLLNTDQDAYVNTTSTDARTEVFEESQSNVYLHALARLAFGLYIDPQRPQSVKSVLGDATEVREILQTFANALSYEVLNKTFLQARKTVIETIIRTVSADSIWQSALKLCLPKAHQEKATQLARTTSTSPLTTPQAKFLEKQWSNAQQCMMSLFVFIKIALPAMQRHLEDLLQTQPNTPVWLSTHLDEVAVTLAGGLSTRIVQMAYCCVQMHERQDMSRMNYDIIAISNNAEETLQFQKALHSIKAPATFKFSIATREAIDMNKQDKRHVCFTMQADQVSEFEKLKTNQKKVKQVEQFVFHVPLTDKSTEPKDYAFICARSVYIRQEDYFLNAFNRLSGVFDEINWIIKKPAGDGTASPTSLEAMCSVMHLSPKMYYNAEEYTYKTSHNTYFFGVPLRLTQTAYFYDNVGWDYIEEMRQRQLVLTRAWNSALIKWVGQKTGVHRLYDILNVHAWSNFRSNKLTEKIASAQLMKINSNHQLEPQESELARLLYEKIKPTVENNDETKDGTVDNVIKIESDSDQPDSDESVHDENAAPQAPPVYVFDSEFKLYLPEETMQMLAKGLPSQNGEKYRFINNPANGSCFYEALAFGLRMQTGKMINDSEIRKQTYDEFIRRKTAALDRWRQNGDPQYAHTISNLEKQIEEADKRFESSAAADGDDQLIAAQLFNVKIIVVESYSASPQGISDVNEQLFEHVDLTWLPFQAVIINQRGSDGTVLLYQANNYNSQHEHDQQQEGYIFDLLKHLSGSHYWNIVNENKLQEINEDISLLRRDLDATKREFGEYLFNNFYIDNPEQSNRKPWNYAKLFVV